MVSENLKGNRLSVFDHALCFLLPQGEYDSPGDDMNDRKVSRPDAVPRAQGSGLWDRTWVWGCIDTSWVFYLLLICISRFSTAPVPRHLEIRGPFLVTDMTVYRGAAGIPCLVDQRCHILKYPQQWHTKGACPALMTREL